MAQTTTAISACDAGIALIYSGGTYDISGSSNAVDITIARVIEATQRAIEDTPRVRAVMRSIAFALTVVYSTTGNEGLDVLRDWASGEITSVDTYTLQIDVPDSTAGSDRYSSAVTLADFNFSLGSGDASPVTVSAALEGTGAYTVSSIS